MNNMTKKKDLNFSKLDIDIMYAYIHKDGNKYDGLAYLYSTYKNDEELNTYIMAKINYDTHQTSFECEKLYSVMTLAMNNFENKYKDLLGEYSMFTVDKKSLELEEEIIKKYPEFDYNNETKKINLVVDKNKIEDFFRRYCYRKTINDIEKILFYHFGIPITIGDDNIPMIQKNLGDLGVSIYQKYYDWYKDNGKYEYTDYTSSFYYGKIDEINEYLDEVIEFTEQNKEISPENKLLVIEEANKYKEKILEYKRTKEEQEI